jgi:hypothetical protein
MLAFNSGGLQAVDEGLVKEYLVHTPVCVFSQVRAMMSVKLFLFPQVRPQAVHKLCRLVHRLSTPVDGSRLCGWGKGG